MNLSNFYKKYNGKPLEFSDPTNKNQCVDLMRGYIKECLMRDPYSLPRALYAKDIFKNAVPNINWDKITNKPTNVPVRGDIVFWGTYPFVTGIAGHVAIFEAGDVNSFISFDQNYPTGSVCHFQRHSYRGVMGWMHPKGVTI